MSSKIISAHKATGVRETHLGLEKDKFLIALENMVSDDEDPFPGGRTIEFTDEPTMESAPIEKPKKKKKSKTTE